MMSQHFFFYKRGHFTLKKFVVFYPKINKVVENLKKIFESRAVLVNRVYHTP